ncbi:MAG: hypothetical protein JWM98_3360, partial [Thermoleophilia bacterium]|nr:hypothetical protein [Thermoleophilia bacterium]
MFDKLLNRYSLRCPETGHSAWIPVSSFRVVRRLRGATAPAVFRVE